MLLMISVSKGENMPTISNEDRAGHLRTTIQIQPGEMVKLCRCMRSKEMPFCDGIHKSLSDTNAGPVIVEVSLPVEAGDPSKPPA
jgi:CDGSH-type Zn-finger protein